MRTAKCELCGRRLPLYGSLFRFHSRYVEGTKQRCYGQPKKGTERDQRDD